MYQPIHYHRRRFRGNLKKRRFIWWFWLLAYLLAILLLIGVGYTAPPYAVMQSYHPFSYDIMGQIQVHHTRIPHLLAVQFEVLDKYHHTLQKENCYSQQGTQLTFGGDVLIFDWSLPGLYSGFKLTRFSGCSTDATLKNALNLSDLNGGDDSYFATVRNLPWLFPMVQAQYSQPVPLPVDVAVGQESKTLLLLITPTGLIVSSLQ